MSATQINVITQVWRVARSVSQTSNAYVAKNPTNTMPAGDAGTATGSSVYALDLNGGAIPQSVMIAPFGFGVATNTFSFKVIGWTQLGNNPATWIWVPTPLAIFACTLGTTPGVGSLAVPSTALFASTITQTLGDAANITTQIISPAADNTIAHVVVDLKGSQQIELSFNTGGSATSCNALWKFK